MHSIIKLQNSLKIKVKNEQASKSYLDKFIDVYLLKENIQNLYQ